MKEERKKLLYSVLFMIIYIIFEIFYLKYDGGLISKNKEENIINLITFGISFIGIIYYFVLYIRPNIDLNNHSSGILIWAIIFFLINIVSGIFGFIVYGKLDKKKEKRELPEIKYEEYTNKWLSLLLFIICIALMFFVSDYLNGYKIIIEYITIFLIMVLLFRKQLIHDFKLFKTYFREYNSLVFKTWFKSIITMMILSLSIQLITNIETATNQENLNQMFTKLPILIVFLTMIYAPVVEELMFRVVFRKFINNKYLFIILSGVVFGALHVIDDFKSVAELLYIFVYSSLGMYLASLYYKTNNICTNIYFHFIQNTFSVIGMIILQFMG